MDYRKAYDLLISHARKEKRKKGGLIHYEEHHIIPKSLGGTDKKSNLVLFTQREHFLAHYLLWKIYPIKPIIDALYVSIKNKNNTNTLIRFIFDKVIDDYNKVRYTHVNKEDTKNFQKELLLLQAFH